MNAKMQNKAGWAPLETDPDNCVTARWKKESGHLCAELEVRKTGEVVGIVKSNDDERITGEIEFKELSNLDQAFEEVGKMLDALASVELPHIRTPTPKATSREVSVG